MEISFRAPTVSATLLGKAIFPYIILIFKAKLKAHKIQGELALNYLFRFHFGFDECMYILHL